MSAPGTPPPAARPAAPRRNHHARRRWLPWAGALALAGLLVAGLWPNPLEVETARVIRGPLSVTVNEEGRTRVQQRFVISAPVAGQLRRIPFKSGAEVVAGRTLIAVIDPVSPAMLDARTRETAGARRETARANLERARAQLEFAGSERRRVERLFAEQTVSRQELENAQWRETAADKEMAAATSALRQAESELAEFGGGGTNTAARVPTEIISPVSGRILRVFEESSRVVAPGTPLVEVGDPADLEVVIEALSRDGALIRPGTRVWLEHWGGAAPLEARVRLVEPAAFTKVSALGVEEQRVNVIADLVTPPAGRAGLGDAFRVEGRIVVWETADTLKVPSGAVFRRGQAWAAYVLEGGRAVLRPVQAGQASGSETQILDGLKEGETVILYPGDRVKPGSRVTPIRI